MEQAGEQRDDVEQRGRCGADQETRVVGVETRQDDGTVVDPLAASHPPDPCRPQTDDTVGGRPQASRQRRGRHSAGRRHQAGWTHTLPGRVRRRRSMAHLLSLLKLRRVLARGARILLGIRRQPRLTGLDEGSLHH